MTFFNESTWVAISFCVVIGLGFKRLKHYISEITAKHRESIVLRIKEAEQISKESKAMLEKANLALSTAKADVKTIRENAAIEAVHIMEEAKSQVEKFQMKHNQMMLDRLIQSEAEIMRIVKAGLINKSFDNLELLMNNTFISSIKTDLMKSSINKIKQNVH